MSGNNNNKLGQKENLYLMFATAMCTTTLICYLLTMEERIGMLITTSELEK